jgi:hypothetical protein
VAFRQAEGAYLHKRIHADCAGGEVDDVWRQPVYLAPLRALRRDLLVATHYLQIVNPWLRMVLRALIPVKLFFGIKFHVKRFLLNLLIMQTQ